MDREVERIKALYPQARYMGIADGARGNWDFLEPRTETQVVDFYHAAEYLSEAADVLFAGKPQEKERWLEDRCHRDSASDLIITRFRILANQNIAKILGKNGTSPIETGSFDGLIGHLRNPCVTA
jgi:hypothetical protein